MTGKKFLQGGLREALTRNSLAHLCHYVQHVQRWTFFGLHFWCQMHNRVRNLFGLSFSYGSYVSFWFLMGPYCGIPQSIVKLPVSNQLIGTGILWHLFVCRELLGLLFFLCIKKIVNMVEIQCVDCWDCAVILWKPCKSSSIWINLKRTYQWFSVQNCALPHDSYVLSSFRC